MAPLVQNATGLDGADPGCVVHIIGCTGDWTGSWDCSRPEGADRFITPDLRRGRSVEVIERGEPAFMVAHWTGLYANGQELGFRVFQEVVRRLQARYDHLLWMRLSEVARYWAARELTGIELRRNSAEPLPAELGARESLKAAMLVSARFSEPPRTVRWERCVGENRKAERLQL